MNIIFGERYKMVPAEVRAYVRANMDASGDKEEIRKKIIGDEEPITYRPADALEPALEQYRNEIKAYLEQEEDACHTLCSRRLL